MNIDAAQGRGEITVFLDALGTEGGLFALPSVLGLVGPTYDVVDTDGVESEHVAFPRTGTHLFFKRQVLIGVLIYVVDNGSQLPYSKPTELMVGLAPGASRSEVREVMGEPRQGSQFMDLFMLDGKYVRFEYDGDSWTSLALLMPGQESL